MPKEPILTGAEGLHILGLDGFREQHWPELVCRSHDRRGFPGVVTTNRRCPTQVVEGRLLASTALMLRHLCVQLNDLWSPLDRVRPEERLELAVEHADRARLVRLDDLRTCGRGVPNEKVLREIVRRRGAEPATESYAETRAAQFFRRNGITAWRQVHIYDGDSVVARVDFLIPFDPRARRPAIVPPGEGIIVEIDSEAYHVDRIEPDRRRMANLIRLGYAPIAFTPNQVEHSPEFVLTCLRSFLDRRAA